MHSSLLDNEMNAHENHTPVKLTPKLRDKFANILYVDDPLYCTEFDTINSEGAAIYFLIPRKSKSS